MAAHTFIKSRKVMKVEIINQLLNDLNNKFFKNCLSFEFDDKENLWLVRIGKYDTRTFWLNTSRTLEFRHGGGYDFTWWVSTVILISLADRFDGRVKDCSGNWELKIDDVDTYPKYFKYCYRNSRYINNLIEIKIEEMEINKLPKEFIEEMQNLTF
jgi:hypothetical protein